MQEAMWQVMKLLALGVFLGGVFVGAVVIGVWWGISAA